MVPIASSVDASLGIAFDVYQVAADLILERYGMRLLRADEGGLAPPCSTAEEMIELAVEAVAAAGYRTGGDVVLALDVASTHFFGTDGYRLGDEVLSSAAMVDRLGQWIADYPIVSLEDGLAEDDWTWWPKLLETAGNRSLVMGDDLLCTNPARIRRAIDSRACNALLLKVNQIGTLTEAAEALSLARNAGWQVTLSVRSGETEDNWAADLAVGWAADQFKNGYITQSERLSKYNRLLAIEAETPMPINPWPRSRSLLST